jgi:hypothetical protein
MLNQRIQKIPMPRRLKKLKISSQGYPIPWFVPWVNSEPEFRAFDEGKRREAWLCRRCWICGDALGKLYSFVIGPMCMLNRIGSEPPSHHECAQYAVQACPFLAAPRMRRNEKELLEKVKPAAGIHLNHNPGIAVLWTTTKYVPFNAGILSAMGRVAGQDPGIGVLFRLGNPVSTEFWREGRRATRAEVLAAIDASLPALRERAEQEGCTDELMARYETAIQRAPQEEELISCE